MTMLEKAARALAVNYYNHQESEQEWRHFVRSARAVLEAVRVPNMSNWIDADCNEDDHPITVFSAIMDTYLAERKSNDPE